MEKRKYFINNHSSDNIFIAELNISIPPGTHNLFEIDSSLTYGQIGHSTKNGTLSAAMDNGVCSYIHDFSQQHSLSKDVILRKPLHVQIFPSRTRFTVVQNTEGSIFDDGESADLFEDENIKPARLIEQELMASVENIEEIAATIKKAEILERPFENKYAPVTPKIINEEKIKNDISKGWITCNGFTAEGKRCTRQAKKNKEYCGLHSASKK